ncbi:Uncharacterised protein [Vibrio cholerae]|uniref:Uncharacterized protein n=1 Tax=Vibrio cholerae TaxID=666 RepID=A0A655WSB2_VIBCL|nr:Uncharacterised protein [Vibrio cholerae]
MKTRVVINPAMPSANTDSKRDVLSTHNSAEAMSASAIATS